jgi:protein O-mannosyl-transferase
LASTANVPGFWTQAEETTKDRFCLALLLLCAACVYANTLLNGFTQDDLGYIVRNTQVTDPSWHSLLAAHRTSNVFRPLTFATYALDWKVGGGVALGFHAVNLVLHALVSCLVFILAQALLRESTHARTIALAAALLFAVHPIHTEAVAAIVGRAELLAAGFLILAWILHLQDRELPALLCFILALLSKESAAVFLPLVLIGDYATGKWKPRLSYWSIAGITAVYLALLWKVQGGRFGPADISVIDNPLAEIPAAQRILNALRVAWKYVGLQLYPATLSADYSYNQIPVYGALRYTLPAAIATALVSAAWLWAAAKRYRGLILAGGIYAAAFLITANILKPIGTIMAERLVYLPSLGFCLLVALGWNWLWQRSKTMALGLAVGAIAILGARTIKRNFDWQDNRTLAVAQMRAAPHSVKTHQNMALVYMDQKRFDLAQQELEIELQIYPQNPIGLATYGLLESWQGNYDDAGRKMEQAFYTMRRDDPAYDEIAVNLAALYIKTDHIDGALDLLNREIAKSPRYGPAWANRALVHYKRGETDGARADAETALRLDANNRDAQDLMRLLNSSAPSISQ